MIADGQANVDISTTELAVKQFEQHEGVVLQNELIKIAENDHNWVRNSCTIYECNLLFTLDKSILAAGNVSSSSSSSSNQFKSCISLSTTTLSQSI